METIDGVTITPLKQISDYRGKIMKMIDVYSITTFGEMYFSVIHPGIVKAWHIHKQMSLNYACVYGKIQLVLLDERKTSTTFTNMMEIYLSPDDYKLVHIPPMVTNGFKGLGTTDSIVANLASIPHDENEIMRFSLDYFKYDWFKKGQ